MSEKVRADHKLNWHYREITTGDDAMLTAPTKLADMLVTLVD